MGVIDPSFKIEGSLLYLSEVSNMTLRGSLTSNESSLSSLGCILSRQATFRASVLQASFQSCFSQISMDSGCLLMLLTLWCSTFWMVSVGSSMYTLLEILTAGLFSGVCGCNSHLISRSRYPLFDLLRGIF